MNRQERVQQIVDHVKEGLVGDEPRWFTFPHAWDDPSVVKEAARTLLNIGITSNLAAALQDGDRNYAMEVQFQRPASLPRTLPSHTSENSRPNRKR